MVSIARSFWKRSDLMAQVLRRAQEKQTKNKQDYEPKADLRLCLSTSLKLKSSVRVYDRAEVRTEIASLGQISCFDPGDVRECGFGRSIGELTAGALSNTGT
jgi:hypothetical protein